MKRLRTRCRRAGIANAEIILGNVDDPLFPGDLIFVLRVKDEEDKAEPSAVVRGG